MTTDTHSSGSTFADVVEKLSARPADSAEYSRATASNSGIAAQPKHEPAYVSPSNLSQIYETTLSHFGRSRPPQPAAAAPVAAQADPTPAPLPSVDPGVIARELKLRRWHSVDKLLEIRRRFAMTNHPDRVESHVRDAATVRMGIANTMIDDAIAACEPAR